MKKAEFQRFLTQQLTRLQTLTSTKGEEYAGAAQDDQFANFKRQAQELGLREEQVLQVYLSKHLDAIKNFIKTQRVLSEPIGGRIDDAILYLILLRAMISEKTVHTARAEDKVKGIDPDALRKSLQDMQRQSEETERLRQSMNRRTGQNPIFGPTPLGPNGGVQIDPNWYKGNVVYGVTDGFMSDDPNRDNFDPT